MSSIGRQRIDLALMPAHDYIRANWRAAMKTALNVAVALTLCAFSSAGNASAQTETLPEPPPAAIAPSAPGIIVVPPRLAPERPASGEKAPFDNAQPQSCPDTGSKLELVV